MSKESRLFLWQRISALVLAPLVLIHIAVILYAVQDGLSAEEILARTRGSLFWMGYYGLFVLAAGLHGAIGLRRIAAEWLGISGNRLDLSAILVAIVLIALGMRAVVAVTW